MGPQDRCFGGGCSFQKATFGVRNGARQNRGSQWVNSGPVNLPPSNVPAKKR